VCTKRAEFLPASGENPGYGVGMTETSIRAAYPTWPRYQSRLRDVVASLSAEALALRGAGDGWPLWATIGHLACQRVFWLCDFAGEPGAATTRFTNAAYDCPGDDDLEHVLSVEDLVDALDSTFRIVERVLDTWTFASLEEVLRRPEWDASWVHTRGAVLERVFSHDVYHVADINGVLGTAGLGRIDLWSREDSDG
jgi:uncharacterized damage-inducible protein DinB